VWVNGEGFLGNLRVRVRVRVMVRPKPLVTNILPEVRGVSSSSTGTGTRKENT
jgi:hypothetical protein